MRRRRRLAWALATLGVLGAAGTWLAAAAHVRHQIRLARLDLDRRQVRAALNRLEAIGASWLPGRNDELNFRLGQARWLAGRRRAAVAAFRTLHPASPHGMMAVPYLAEAAIQEGRFHEAETRLLAAIAARPEDPSPIWRLIETLYRTEARNDELRILYLNRVDFEEDPEPALRALWQLDRGAAPLEALQKKLEEAGRAAPDDPRVRLGQARLAILAGRLDEADTRLRACEAVAPDAAVWRARLDWAEAARRPDEALRALKLMRPQELQPSEWWRWRAWLLRQAGAPAEERKALLAWLTCEPSRPSVIERLAELAIRAGDETDATHWRQRKAQADRALLHYERLLTATADFNTAAEYRELASIAAAAGRARDARAWARLAVRSDPTAASLAALAREWENRANSGTAPAPGPGPAQAPDPDPAEILAGLDALISSARQGVPASGSDSRIEFADETEVNGLRMVFDNGEDPLHRNPEALSGGIGLLDYDGDGWLDVYVLQGGPFPPDGSRSGDGDRLFRNRGDGTFEDATEHSGIGSLRQGYGHGVSVGDIDNDGDPDLFVTRWRHYALYRNDGGRFVDVTEPWGLGGERGWPSSSALADLDGDGDLDLYVCHYMRYDPETTPPCRNSSTNTYICCFPLSIPAEPDHVYRNDGGRFVDVSAEAGLLQADGRGLGVIAADLDDDGRIDLFVANDMTANLFYRNLGGFRFEEQAHAAGVAGNASGGYQAGMGAACADFDRDGRFDLAVTNYYTEGTSLFRNLGHGLFADCSGPVGLASATKYRLGFGIAFLDADNDGRLDLLQANGHLYPAADRPYRMPIQLLAGGDDGFVDVSSRAGPLLAVPRLGRALAVGDLDHDGRLDAVVIDHNAPLVALSNRTRDVGRWLIVRLEGTVSNRDAVGAVATVSSGEKSWSAQRSGGGSYQSASDPRIHFGLGPQTEIVDLSVRWPSNRVDRYPGLRTNQAYRIREGDSAAHPLEGFRPPTP